MKKVLMFLMAMVITLSSFAQSMYVKDTPKFFDNTYVTLNGGIARPMLSHYKDGNLLKTDFWQDLNANVGIRVGKDITPIFGVALGSNAYFSEFGRQSGESGLWIKYLNTTVLAKVNVLNCFGYNPDRKFNLSVLTGPGWAHDFTTGKNDATANFAVNAGYDIGKRFAIYVEPTLIYGLENSGHGLAFNSNRAVVQVNVGVVYKFGKTKFTKSEYVPISDYDAANARINTLTHELAKKPREVEKEVTKVVTEYINNTTVITFAQGSYELTQSAKNQLDELTKTVKAVKVISGTASPEGSKEFNDRLSLLRAQTVARYLAQRKVYADAIEGLGVTGDESQRIVTITIK